MDREQLQQTFDQQAATYDQKWARLAPLRDATHLLIGSVAERVVRFAHCPVLVLRGSQSDVLSDAGAQEVAKLIPDARLATIGAAGHHAAGDNPETTVTLVRGFLDEIAY